MPPDDRLSETSAIRPDPHLTDGGMTANPTMSGQETAIPGYEILQVLGGGGMGVVYRAKQISLDRVVALKTIHSNLESNAVAVSRFEQEARTIGRLQHPNIVTAYDFQRFKDRWFFAMEVVEGENLEAFIERQSPLTETTAWHLARQVAAGLAHAHAAGVIHRDIKPANILLTARPTGHDLTDGIPLVKISDFGLALLTVRDTADTRLTQSNSMMGSPRYMAPEQISGSDVDCRADIYSLGVTLYHMLAGEAPLSGLPLPQLLRAKLVGDIPPLAAVRSNLQPETIALIDRMLAPKLEDRIATYPELLAAIDRLVAPHGPGTSTAAGALATKPARIPRRTWLTLAAGGAAVATTIGGWKLLSGNRTKPRDLAPVGNPLLLLDGKELNLKYWQLGESSGGWSIQGGAIVHQRKTAYLPCRLPDWDHFQLELNVHQSPETTVAVRFGLKELSGTSPHQAVRLSQGSAVLAEWTDSQGYGSLGNSHPLDDDREMNYLRLEKQSHDWWVVVNDTVIGTLPVERGTLPAFALATENGPAAFSEIIATELRAADKG